VIPNTDVHLLIRGDVTVLMLQKKIMCVNLKKLNVPKMCLCRSTEARGGTISRHVVHVFYCLA
jgi:hypothetical protein